MLLVKASMVIIFLLSDVGGIECQVIISGPK